MTTAVVTGASGFIGNHLCARLIADGWDVKVITRGVVPVNTQRLTVTLDCAHEELSEVLSGAHVVYHLAGLAHEGIANKNSAKLKDVNVNETVRIFEAAVAAGVPAVVITRAALRKPERYGEQHRSSSQSVREPVVPNRIVSHEYARYFPEC